METSLELYLFGAIDVKVDGVSLRSNLSAKGRLLLAYLALQAGRAVSTGVIAGDVFPDSAAIDPHEIIKKTVQDVRRVLGGAGARLTAPAPRTLALDLQGVAVDWILFHAAIKRGDPESLQYALALHTRPFLEEETLPWAQGEQSRCLALRGRALEALFHVAMQRDEWEAAGNWLAQMLRFELPDAPLNETLWRQWFERLLERQEHGRLHHHYMRLQDFLERTAGRLPAPETRAQWHRIPKAALSRLTAPQKKRPQLPASVRLPHVPSALIGRDAERRDLIGMFKNSRLVTVVGAGGVGKTRFAIQIGHEIGADYRDEVAFIDLTPCTLGGVLTAIAVALEAAAEARAKPRTSSRDALREAIGNQRLLLILDNCEHRIEEVAALVSDLLAACPHLRLLLTSRERLRVEGEQVFPLLPLALPKAETDGRNAKPALDALRASPAVRLFLERAAAIQPDFTLTPDNAALVARLCRLVDGLPLGIEILASQVAGTPLERIAQDLEARALRMQLGRRGAAARHQTLQAALEYSYGMLNEGEQTLLRRLAVFAGGWTLEAAETVCATENEALPAVQVSPLLARLVAKSLVTFQARGAESLPFQFLETVRLFALAKLREHGEEARFCAAHCRYFRDFAAQTMDMARIEQGVLLRRINRANLRAAIVWGVEAPDCAEAAVRICCDLGDYWEHSGLMREGIAFADALLAKEGGSLSPDVRAELCFFRASRARHSGLDIATEVCPYLEAALERFKATGNRAFEANIYWLLGEIATDSATQRDHYRRALSSYRERGLRHRVAHMMLLSGDCSYQMGQFEEAEQEIQAGLQLAEEGNFLSLRALGLLLMGTVVRRRGDLDHAENLYGQSLAFYRQIDSAWAICLLTAMLGDCRRLKGDYAQAAALTQESLRIALEVDPPAVVFDSIRCAALLCGELEHWETALTLFSGYSKLKPELQEKIQPEISRIEAHVSAEQRPRIQAIAQQQNLRTLCQTAQERLQEIMESDVLKRDIFEGDVWESDVLESDVLKQNTALGPARRRDHPSGIE